MKRRTFFRSLFAVAAIAFAEPLAMLKRETMWVGIDPAWESAEYTIYYDQGFWTIDEH